MKIRPITPGDLVWLDRINTGYRDLPNFRHVITEGVVESNGRRIGYGLTRLFSEAIIIMDPEVSNYQKSKGIITLYNDAIRDVKDAGLDELNAFVDVKDKDYAEMLVKHLGFKVYTGIPLVKEL